MEPSEMKPGRGRRVLAFALATLCVAIALLERTLSSRLNMCAMLLFAWDMAFTPGPSLRTPLREVYGMARRGWRTPWTSKFVALAGIALLVAGQYFAFHGR